MSNYLYNGIELPPLPEWDRETYPYAFILRYHESGNYRLFIASAEVRYYTSSSTTQFIEYTGGYYHRYSDTKWGDAENQSLGFSPTTNYQGVPIWSNYDLYTTDGTLYLAATDPIPVGTPITDPVSFTMGYNWMMAMLAKRAGRKPIGYSYNGTVLPELPKTDLPYVTTAIWLAQSVAYAFSEPLTAEPYKGMNGNTYYSPQANTPFLMCKLMLDRRERNYWTEWETVVDSGEFHWGDESWANHDIDASDGTKFYSASGDPTPVYLPTVLYDGEITTEDASYSDSASATAFLSLDIADGDILKVTINGVSGEYTAEVVETSRQVQVGNAGLNGNDVDAPDDGGDWLVAESTTNSGFPRAYFYTRTAGTYQLKIELIAKGGGN